MTEKHVSDGFDAGIADEYDEFDPLAPIAFDDEDEDEDDEYFKQITPPKTMSIEEAAAERRAKYPIPELTTPEKIAKTIKGMPGQKKLLLHVLDFCRDERTESEICEEIRAFERGTVNVYQPVTIIAMLERCGALIQVNKPAEETPADAAEDADVADAASVDEAQASDQASQDAPAQAAPEEIAAPRPEAAQEQDALDAEAQALAQNAEEIDAIVIPDDEYMEVEVPEEARYRSSDEGLQVVADEDPAARFTAFMGEHPRYAPVFRTILENCDSEVGLTQKQIGTLVDDDPVCREPRRWAGYFIDKLEDADAIIFQSGWHTTDVGRAMLEEDGIIGAL